MRLIRIFLLLLTALFVVACGVANTPDTEPINEIEFPTQAIEASEMSPADSRTGDLYFSVPPDDTGLLLEYERTLQDVIYIRLE